MSMGDLLSKFNLLDTEGKVKLLQYLESLLVKQGEDSFNYQLYKGKIQNVSIWEDVDVLLVEEAQKQINLIKPKSW